MDAQHSVSRLLAAVVPAAVLPFVASFAYFVFCMESVWVQGLYTATKVFTLSWPIIAVVFVLKERLPRLRFGMHHLRAVPLGLVIGLLLGSVILWLALGPFQPLLLENRPQLLKKVAAIGITEHFLWFALGLSVIHSLLEEYFWRWFVFGQLATRFSLRIAHALAAIAFSAHHVVITSQFFGLAWGAILGAAVGVGGAIFSGLYQRQRSLVGAWVAHICADLAIMAVGQHVMTGRFW